MKAQNPKDPYCRVIQVFNQSAVRYVVVGMSGINYYATTPAELFGTLDYDIHLQPTLSNVRKAVESLQKLGFSLGTEAGLLKTEQIAGLVRNCKTLIATTQEGLMVELILKVSGYPFSELERDAATFSVQGIPIKVGRLTKLLRSKRAANRKKDILFLKQYEALMSEQKKK